MRISDWSSDVCSSDLLELVTENGGAHLVAFDVLGTGIGEHVLVAQGSVAAAWFPGAPPPVDALVIGSIDQPPAAKPTRAAQSVAPPTAKATTHPDTAPPLATHTRNTPREGQGVTSN